MTAFAQLTAWAGSQLAVILSASTLAAVMIAVVLKRRGIKARGLTSEDKAGRRKFSAGTLAAVGAFVICTSVSLNTSYRFTGDPEGLAMTSTPERLLACAAFESLMAMCVLGARERMADTDSRSGGWYGSAVWIFAALSAVPAYVEGSGFTPATMVRIIIGSFGSALAAHSALGLELRHRTGDESQTAMAQIMRDVRERLMARLGLAHRSRTAEEITRDRALDKAVDLDDRYRRLADEKKAGRTGRRIARRLAVWQDRAGLATDEAQCDLYRARVAQRQCATELSISAAESPWNRATATQVQARALDTLEVEARHMEAVAADAEAALRAQIGTLGTLPEAQGGTSVPGPRVASVPKAAPEADEESADCIDSSDAKPVEPPKAAAAHGGGTPRGITARVPLEEAQKEPEELAALPRDLRSYPTKRGALEALYHHRIGPKDRRTTNAIAEVLLAELAQHGITLDRGAANRYIASLRPKEADGQAETDSRELVDA
ncbi:hypothetical protein [Streptomyces sp. XY511]|uniref:hypothetical protein n=1 Tax=Streptomyces sp. XY511 TaxID=1519480 RepID=UPI0006AEE416|nr:hypothetical protein [Streptomyces sp. XY511]